jgi:hypothetical protein
VPGLPQAPVRRDEYAVYLTNTQIGDRQHTTSFLNDGERGRSPRLNRGAVLSGQHSGLVPYPDPKLAVAWIRTVIAA